MEEKGNVNSSRGKKIFLSIIVLIVIMLLGYFAYVKYIASEKEEKTPEVAETEKPKEEEKKVKIYDFDSDQRPVAVMLDNNTHAWPHSGINNTYAIYEIEVEGGESRLMALFKDKKDVVKEVGPIRSARHYFLDYAKEHDAIYAHIGQSPRAAKELKEDRMPDINGQIYDTGRSKNPNNTKEYWRDRSKRAPHNSYSSILNLFNIAESRDYKVKTDNLPPFKYAKEEFDLDSGISAYTITGGYHSGNRTVFKYDEDKKEYTKTSKKRLQKDASGDVYTIKNLIVLNAEITPLTGFGSGSSRVHVKTTGSLSGYYITNGKAIKITAKKDTRSSKTKYLDSDGNEIKFNDGRTYVMITPKKEKISIAGNPDEVKETQKEESSKDED